MTPTGRYVAHDQRDVEGCCEERPFMIHSGRTVALPSQKGRAEPDILTRINAKCVSYLATSHHIRGRARPGGQLASI